MQHAQSSNPEGRQARTHRRISASLIGNTTGEFRVKYQYSHSVGSLAGDILTVSPGGLFIRGQKVPDRGTLVFLNFLFGNRPMKCVARVVYTHKRQEGDRPKGFGIKFTTLAEKDHQYIQKEIDEFYRLLSPL